MKEIKITEEYWDKFKDGVEFDDSEFDTEQEIEVRIPFTGYHSIKLNCKNPQIAMAETLEINELVGITHVEDSYTYYGDMELEETYAVVED